MRKYFWARMSVATCDQWDGTMTFSILKTVEPSGLRISLVLASKVIPSYRSCPCFVNCLLNSSLFYWYYSTLADCEHINDSLVKGFPLPKNWEATDWKSLSSLIDKALRSSASSKSITTKQGHVIEYDEIDGKRARDVILQADIALGSGFGLTQAELDYVVNYDIKYRVGQSEDDGERLVT